MTREQLTEQIRKDCHETVTSLLNWNNLGTDYQGATNVYIFSKLAEIELRLRELERKTARLNSENSLRRPLK